MLRPAAAALVLVLAVPAVEAHTADQVWIEQSGFCLWWGAKLDEAQEKAISQNFKEGTFTFENSSDARYYAISSEMVDFYCDKELRSARFDMFSPPGERPGR